MVYALIGYFLLKRLILEHIYIDYRGKYVFITGCDSGFGRLLALKLLKMGVNVFAGCYTENRAQLHGLVNNAGVFTIFGPDDWCSTDEYLASLNVNTLGAVRVCHSFLPFIKKSK
ncbi:hypothetical protein TELCIR_11746, partial [Teladorsagia circumcincta]